jgi:hypothetical protein
MRVPRLMVLGHLRDRHLWMGRSDEGGRAVRYRPRNFGCPSVLVMNYRRKGIPMKTTLVLAVLLAAATPAFAQSSGGPGAPGATMHDYRLAPNQGAANCRIVITHRRGPSGNSITVRRRICQ